MIISIFKLGHSANTRSGIGWLLTRAESDEITLLRERVMFKCSNSDSDSDGDITKKKFGPAHCAGAEASEDQLTQFISSKVKA